MIRPKEAVASLARYKPGGPQDGRRLINLAANENVLGPSPAVQRVLGSQPLEELAVYPDMAGRQLTRLLAERWSLPQENFLLGTGSGHLLKLICETYLEPGDRVIVPEPTFTLYDTFAHMQGAVVERVPFVGLDKVDLSNAKLVFLCSPNNPTGETVVREVIDGMLARLPDNAALVWDQAYIDFASSSDDGASWVREGRPLIITRTFSKVYGLAAARVGYLVAAPEVASALAVAREPFPVGALAMKWAAAALQDEAHADRYRKLVREGRSYLTDALTSAGYPVVPSEANFILVTTGPDTERVKGALLEAGYLVRDTTSFGLPGHLRITIGTFPQMEAVQKIIISVKETRKESSAP